MVVFKLYCMVDIYMISTYSPCICGRKKEALNQLWSLMFFKLSESNNNNKNKRKTPQHAIPSEDKQLHFIMHELLLASPKIRKSYDSVQSVRWFNNWEILYCQMSGGW